MLPPVDPRVLEHNPNFDVLYKDLTTRKLNPDGSTRDTKKQRIHDEIRRVRQLIISKEVKSGVSALPSTMSFHGPWSFGLQLNTFSAYL